MWVLDSGVRGVGVFCISGLLRIGACIVVGPLLSLACVVLLRVEPSQTLPS